MNIIDTDDTNGIPIVDADDEITITTCSYWLGPEFGGGGSPCGECMRCHEADGVAEFTHDAPTRPIPYQSPYPAAMRCQCGYICEGVDMKDIRVKTDGTGRIVRCPGCPRNPTQTSIR